MTQFLDFFATDVALAQLETALQRAETNGGEQERVLAQLAVAWQLRQRDTPRALKLATAAELRLAGTTLAPQQRQTVEARLLLIRGEAQYLAGELEAAGAAAAQALHVFSAAGDGLGRADAHWLAAWAAGDRGDHLRRDAELRAAIEAIGHADAVRHGVALGALARGDAFRDGAAAGKKWAVELPQDSASLHPAASCWSEGFWALVKGFAGDYVQCVLHAGRAYDFALASGQIHRAVVAATNVGVSFNQLNDYDVALEWMQRALDLARSSRAVSSLAIAMMQTAETLQRLQRLDEAHELLQESLVLIASVSGSHLYAMALRILGDVELRRGHWARALESFQRLEQRSTALSIADLHFFSLRGQAQAQLELGRPQIALERAHAALAAAKSNANFRVEVLRVLGDLHARHPLPPPTDMQAASAPLHYLHLALEAATTIQDYGVPAQLLEATAQQYAAAGDYQAAYEYAQQALRAREKAHGEIATNRAIALQTRYETEKARAEAEHHRTLSRAHAERASALEQANATLEQLGVIGREITVSADLGAIFSALDRHVHALLDAFGLLIYQVEGEGAGGELRLVFGVEGGQPLPEMRLSMDSASSLTARCARERRELLIEAVPGELQQLPHTVETLSNLFAPLVAGERLLGVMVITSPRAHAYGEREVAVFRTLCAYGAVALANAQAQSVLSKISWELKTIVENAPIGIFLTSGERRIVRMNRFCEEQVFRCAPGAYLGKPSRVVFLSDEDFTGFAAAAVAQQRNPVTLEWLFCRWDGTPFMVRAIGSLIDPADRSQGAIWLVSDITEARAAEEQLAQALKELEVIFQNVGMGIVYSRGRRILRANQAFSALLGYSPEELRGQSTRMCYATDDDFRTVGEGYAAMAQGRVFRTEARLRRQDATEVLCEMVGCKVDPADPDKGDIWTFADVTQLRRTQSMLIQQEKMATLGQVVANVAHEINTPIAVIKSSGESIAQSLDQTLELMPRLLLELEPPERALFVRLIGEMDPARAVLTSREERALVRGVEQELRAQGVSLPDERAQTLVQLHAHASLVEYLPLLRHRAVERILEGARAMATALSGAAHINVAVARVSKIVFALKSFSHMDASGEMQEVSLREGIDTVLTIYDNQIKRGTELVLNYEDIAPVRCLPDEMNQVWTNLIHNALQAMAGQGTLTVGIRRQDDEAVVSVSDTGCGIPEAIRNRIFDPFFTTKPKGEGSGLGLDIARKIVEKHKGRIEVASALGVGSTFTVYLPFSGP